MIHKIFRTVFILALAIGAASFLVRMKDTPAVPPVANAAKPKDPQARPLAAFRVVEENVSANGIDFRGGNYKARVGTDACVFGAVPEQGSVWASRQFNIEFGTPRLEQGLAQIALERGGFSRAAFGVSRLDHGPVVEEYLFENTRVEQLYRIPARIGSGDLRLSIPVTSDLNGPIVNRAPGQNSFMEMQFAKGGVAFCDTAGVTRLAYHSAVAIDAEGRELAFVPRHENGSIILEVPASFMDRAAYPVVIDPWLDFLGSGTGAGVSGPHGHCENPQLALGNGGLPFVCWADDSAATSALPNNTDIYLRVWNGFDFIDMSGSMEPGGISQTPGKSTHPSLSLGRTGSPAVAWEDDTSGFVNIYLKYLPLANEPGAGNWTSVGGSADSTGGLSKQFSTALHPSVTTMMALIPGVITVDSNGNPTGSSPSKFQSVPVVAFDLPAFGGTQIFCQIFYPGAPAQPATNVNPALPPVPSGWYPVTGTFVANNVISAMSATPAGSVSQYPSLAIDDFGSLHLAWQDTRNGNFEIYYATCSVGSFQVAVNPANVDELDVVSSGPWTAVSGSMSGGGISNTATPSQFPSVAADTLAGTSNVTIAWEETEAAVPPTPGTTSQVYVARSVNAGAWTGLDGSNTTGGISKTLGRATSPSIDVGGGYAAVAWADDSNSRSSIYIRRIFLGAGGSGHWDQVGFQGSAFPALNGETTAPVAGVSESLNYSIQPSLKLDQFGSPTVAWADGSSSNFSILMKVFSPNAPGIATGIGTNTATFQTTLRQTLTDPTLGVAVDVPLAGFVNGTTVFLSSRVFTETLVPPGTLLFLQLEVQPTGNPFTNSPNFQTLFVAPDSPAVTPANLAVFKFDGLPNANYHWQGRTMDQLGRLSPWILFPTDAGGASFRVNVSAPPGSGGTGGNGPVNAGSTGGSSSNKGSCGLLGLDAVALLGFLSLIRRRRSSK
jgi:hypothetical protein